MQGLSRICKLANQEFHVTLETLKFCFAYTYCMFSLILRPQAQANNFGFHKSPGVRFNQLLKQTYFSLGEHDLPATDVETYVISGIAGTVGIPLAAVVTDPRITTSTQQVSQFTQSEEK